MAVSGLNESSFHPSVAIRDGWETGTGRRAVPVRWPEGPCDGCEGPASGFRRPQRSPVFLPVCRDERSPALGDLDQRGPVSD